jgi:arylsulfatase A-like enzyme
MAGVDGAGHQHGLDSDAYRAAVANADRLIGALIDDLVRTGRWKRAIVIVTADHGFDVLRPGTSGHIETSALTAKGDRVVADGGTAHVYAATSGALDGTIAKASRHPAVAAIYARTPGLGAPAPPPDWHLTNPRMGDVILIARPGFTFVDGPRDRTRKFRGDHGGPAEIPIPLIVVGGHPALRPAPDGVRASCTDVVPTAAWLLDIAPPRRIDGTPVASPDAGRALAELLGGQ